MHRCCIHLRGPATAAAAASGGSPAHLHHIAAAPSLHPHPEDGKGCSSSCPCPPVDVFGKRLFEPLRSPLIAAAQKRGLARSIWIQSPLCAKLRLSLSSTAEVVEIPLPMVQPGSRKAKGRDDSSNAAITVASFVNVADVVLPRNVDARCMFQPRGRLMRTVVGGWFSTAVSELFAAAAAARGLHSTCWVNAPEVAFLGWTPTPQAVPVEVAIHEETLKFFNTEDIADVVDFDTHFFTDRRILHVETGKRFSALTVLQWRRFLLEKGVLKGEDCNDKHLSTKFGGAARALTSNRGVPSGIDIRADAEPFACLMHGDVVQLFVAAQTTDPEGAVAKGLAAKAALDETIYRRSR